ncbi:FUSC family protein [Niallia circulans]|uniref:FUSC family protein n=1 Tax=Niallia circulans TaxID=1397 RepID=UPI0039793F5B
MKINRWNDKTILIMKMAIGSAIAWQLSKLIGSSHSYLAPLSLILCLQPSLEQSVQFSIRRVVGTIIGVLMTIFFIQYVPLTGWILGIFLFAGTGIALIFGLNTVIIHQVALSILLVFALEKHAGNYGLDRIVDTVLGGILAVFLQLFIFPPNVLNRTAVINYAEKYDHLLTYVSSWIASDFNKQQADEVDRLNKKLLQTIQEIDKNLLIATKNIKYTVYNRRGLKKTINTHSKNLAVLKECHSYLINIIAILKEWNKAGGMSLLEKDQLLRQINLIGKVFRVQLTNEASQKEKENSNVFILQNPFLFEVDCYRGALYVEIRKLAAAATK